ncbi:hypothetical protein FR483_n334L [Paramecium bursaria Chlorella virus FR483]|uniref:Uncharacterized protein n334L n=1 Tax=Paramecium bursaria Chlorella virus FR483 TaxID=399781 RepID=A7J738_PBCVF|nr:hypothetical protein FR483_n334L [Paramecium bursaria Chlorella virus FR483]ABT15619.1 hypothetical protein FR483_n334L [Paramecium bursaria Chlorella virus FR483]
MRPAAANKKPMTPRKRMLYKLAAAAMAKNGFALSQLSHWKPYAADTSARDCMNIPFIMFMAAYMTTHNTTKRFIILLLHFIFIYSVYHFLPSTSSLTLRLRPSGVLSNQKAWKLISALSCWKSLRFLIFCRSEH